MNRPIASDPRLCNALRASSLDAGGSQRLSVRADSKPPNPLTLASILTI